MEENFSIKPKKEEKKIFRCDICNSENDFLLCEGCFKLYNSAFEENINNLLNTEKTMVKKINNLLLFNTKKSDKLNTKIFIDKYKEILEVRISQEEFLIDKYRNESEKYKELLSKQKEKNEYLIKILENCESKNNENNDTMYNSSINMSNLILQNDNKDSISNLKNQIFELSTKIKNFKKKYIFNLFEELFINKKTIIKISDFFEDKQYQENDMNYSIISTTDTKSNNNNNHNNNNDQKETVTRKEIKIEILKKNDIFFKRFNSFFKTMLNFLVQAYNKFKLKMPFKINHSKIIDKNDKEFNCEITKSQLKDQTGTIKLIKGYNLLNINYIYLLQNIFGDTFISNWFDLSLFLNGKDENLGSLGKILEESKVDNNEKEIDGFIVIDD